MTTAAWVAVDIRTCQACRSAFPAPHRPGRPPRYCPPCRAAVEAASHTTVTGGVTARVYRRACRTALIALQNGRPAAARAALERVLQQ